jgi:hypothetical protein
VQQPTTSTPVAPVATTTLKPTYTEAELTEKIGVIRSYTNGNRKILPMSILTDPGNQSAHVSIHPPLTYSITENASNAAKNEKILADWDETIKNSQIIFNGQSYTSISEITGLAPFTYYDYQFIYSEEGRETTVIHKKLYTYYN